MVNTFKPKYIPHKRWNLDREDYLQVGYIGLLKAIHAFDESRGVAFQTFAWLCIKREIINFYNKEKKYHSRCISLENRHQDEAWGMV